jgi:hypothetical protein
MPALSKTKVHKVKNLRIAISSFRQMTEAKSRIIVTEIGPSKVTRNSTWI